MARRKTCVPVIPLVINLDRIVFGIQSGGCGIYMPERPIDIEKIVLVASAPPKQKRRQKHYSTYTLVFPKGEIGAAYVNMSLLGRQVGFIPAQGKDVPIHEYVVDGKEDLGDRYCGLIFAPLSNISSTRISVPVPSQNRNGRRKRAFDWHDSGITIKGCIGFGQEQARQIACMRGISDIVNSADLAGMKSLSPQRLSALLQSNYKNLPEELRAVMPFKEYSSGVRYFARR